MEGSVYYSKKNMKRKEITDSNNHEDFSDFSLSSPATKIRRLDAELPPIIEEGLVEEPDVTVSVDEEEQQQLGFENNRGISDVNASVTIEELPTLENNPERALVLFNPLNTSNITAPSPSPFGVSVNSRLLSGFKGRYPWFDHSNSFNLPQERFQDGDGKEAKSQCQAVVPWVASQAYQQVQEVPAQSESPEFMEAESLGESSTMEVEDYNFANAGNGYGSHVFGGLGHDHQGSQQQQQQQQQQQHWMMLQLPHNIATPITWSS